MTKYILAFLLLASAVLAEPIGGVRKVVDPAQYKAALEEDYKPAVLNDTFEWGDAFKTGPKGFLGLMFFEDGTMVKLGASSSAILEYPDAKTKRKIKIDFGDFWSKVTRSDIGMVIETPSTTASVKGTSFWFFVSPTGDTRVLCQEGLIDVLNNISGEHIFVSAGQMINSSMNGMIDALDFVPEGTPQPENVPEPEGGGESEGSIAPQGGPGGTEPPAPAGGGSGLGLNMNGAVGAATINGENYQYFSLRPDISFWKFGIGLDLSLYFDSDGNVREEDWDEASDYMEKIYYIRYGKPGDHLYLRGGSLSPITLGYGLIMKRYTNAIEWPQVRRIGLQTEMNFGKLKIEALLNNFNEIETPGLVGGRVSYEAKALILPVVVGGTFVMDGNQYLGAKDEDGDGVPDNWDMFPGINDQNHINWMTGNLDSLTLVALVGSGDLPDIYNPSPNIGDLEEKVQEYGIDIGIPIIRSKALNLWIYSQMAQIVDFGKGFTVPGVMFNAGPFRAAAEYRIFEAEFMGEFFDMNYETQRVTWSDDSTDYLTKVDQLAGLTDATGYYAEAGVNIFNLLDVMMTYQDMSFDGMDNLQTVYGAASLNTKFIPKISLAEAYFWQQNVDKPFTMDADGTVLGYKVGFAVGGGVSIIYDNKTIYNNGEPNRIMTIETALTF